MRITTYNDFFSKRSKKVIEFFEIVIFTKTLDFESYVIIMVSQLAQNWSSDPVYIHAKIIKIKTTYELWIFADCINHPKIE